MIALLGEAGKLVLVSLYIAPWAILAGSLIYFEWKWRQNNKKGG